MKPQLAYKCPRCRAEIEVGGISISAGVFRDFCQYCNSENLIKVQEFKTYKVVQVEKGEGMREIKFRGKRVDNGEWVYGSLIYSPATDLNNGIHSPTSEEYRIRSHEYTWNNKEKCYRFEVYEVYPETVGQHTGLYDKDDKKIYEGDILSFLDNTLTCHYKYAGHGIVIGNIHDNPELLQADEKRPTEKEKIMVESAYRLGYLMGRDYEKNCSYKKTNSKNNKSGKTQDGQLKKQK